MYYYKARIYSPTLGRFLQTDPIGYEDGMNWYAYAGNDPINMVDPLGLDDEDAITITGKRLLGLGSGMSNGVGIISLGGRVALNHRPKSTYKVPEKGHYYRRPARLCTAGPGKPCHIDRVSSKACVLPGHTSSKSIKSGQLYPVYARFDDIIPKGVVRSTQTGSLSFRNTTTWAHPFAGTVDRIFSQDAQGNIDVVTIGRGDSSIPGADALNDVLGPGIFDQQNEVCSSILGGK